MKSFFAYVTEVRVRGTQTHTYTHTLASAAPMSHASIMCQDTSKLSQKVPYKKTHHPLFWPSGLPSCLLLSLLFWPPAPFFFPHSIMTPSVWFVLFPYLIHPSLSTHLLSTLIFLLSYLITLHTLFIPHASLSFSNTLLFSHPPFLHLRTWQSYHYPATYLLTACYFPFALRGPGAKSLPRILDPSHRIYPGVAWGVRSTPAAPPFFSCSFPHSLFSLSLALSFCLSSIGFFSIPWPLMQIRALLFKELSTHNPTDGSIFGELHIHTHTHICACRKAECITHSIRIQGHMLSPINIHTNWHAHVYRHTHELREKALLCSMGVIFWAASALSCSWAITTSKPAGCRQQPCSTQLGKHWHNLNLSLMCQCKYLYFCSLQRPRKEVKTRVKR